MNCYCWSATSFLPRHLKSREWHDTSSHLGLKSGRTDRRSKLRQSRVSAITLRTNGWDREWEDPLKIGGLHQTTLPNLSRIFNPGYYSNGAGLSLNTAAVALPPTHLKLGCGALLGPDLSVEAHMRTTFPSHLTPFKMSGYSSWPY